MQCIQFGIILIYKYLILIVCMYGFRKDKEIHPHQTGKTVVKRDIGRGAIMPGVRISRNGKKYYEYRKNRTDMGGSI